MRKKCNNEEKNNILEQLKLYGFTVNNDIDYAIDGATVLKFNNTGTRIDLWYAEDNLYNDRSGIPYIISMPYYNYLQGIQPGNRMIVVYGSDGSYHVIPTNGKI